MFWLKGDVSQCITRSAAASYQTDLYIRCLTRGNFEHCNMGAEISNKILRICQLFIVNILFEFFSRVLQKI